MAKKSPHRTAPLGATTRDRATVQLRVTTAEQRAFTSAAVALDLTISEWLRMLGRRASGLWTGEIDEKNRTEDKST